ncbi:hypothetical protein V1525DRAFT_395870 [Lipomyces kononenkoae]|uniref:Uncharacterized protein n=1 Tax=Lipomyces kononenkoae TaxID=34357 RepID=A0ACC3T9F2_LIPKO
MPRAGDAWRVSQSFPSRTIVNKDDWREVKDPVERRKRQNRLRQRAWRERQKAANGPKTTPPEDDSSWKGHGMLLVVDQHDDPVTSGIDFSVTTPSSNDTQDGSACQILALAADHRSRLKKHKHIPPILAYSTYATIGQPPPPIILPLSPDHRLITLVQYNVIRAVMCNLSILSMLGSESFGVPSFDATAVRKIPLDLQFTPLQQSTPHVYWISAIPFPSMRDNMILMADKYDIHDLAYDLGEGLYQGLDDSERRGFLVWGDPWSGRGWEVSEGFVKKWGFLLKGCPDVIQSTNRWRELYDEDRLNLSMP